MQTIDDDPDIRQDAFRLDTKLTRQQVCFVAQKLQDLVNNYTLGSRDERMRLTEWLQWDDFIDVAYACGFVRSDAGEDMGDDAQTPILDGISRLQQDPRRVEDLTLRDLRRILHYIIRSQRWGDAGADIGGAVWGLISLRLGGAIASRLGA